MHVIGYVFWKFYVAVKKYQKKLLLNRLRKVQVTNAISIVLEDISIHSVAGKDKTLKQCQGNRHTTPSRDTVEKKSL